MYISSSLKVLVASAKLQVFSRSVNGLRVTSCKSAKDRTGMAVTLEQGKLLESHGVDRAEIDRAVAVMRGLGVRRTNVQKNTGSPQYSFNAIQRRFLPTELQPPSGTYGGTIT